MAACFFFCGSKRSLKHHFLSVCTETLSRLSNYTVPPSAVPERLAFSLTGWYNGRHARNYNHTLLLPLTEAAERSPRPFLLGCSSSLFCVTLKCACQRKFPENWSGATLIFNFVWNQETVRRCLQVRFVRVETLMILRKAANLHIWEAGTTDISELLC